MAVAINTTNNFWNILKFLSNDIKLQLIAKLSDSMVTPTPRKAENRYHL